MGLPARYLARPTITISKYRWRIANASASGSDCTFAFSHGSAMLNAISLSTSEAVCLEALRSGADRKMLIALRAGLNLKQAKQALETLASLDLAITNHYRTWHLTPQGKAANISIAPVTRRRGRPPSTGGVPGGSAVRLLALLDRPRRGAELTTLLGVTRQRVHQVVVALSVRGLIRSADPNFPYICDSAQG
jgi:hypothetical protein